jgi:hypothetical protein
MALLNVRVVVFEQENFTTEEQKFQSNQQTIKHEGEPKNRMIWLARRSEAPRILKNCESKSKSMAAWQAITKNK